MTFQTMMTALCAALALNHVAVAADWITAPSYYSHDPTTGERVTQYSPIGPFYTYARPDYRRSGYRNTRSSIQAGNSTDNMHIVEEWGRPIRPYGEWRFPYRPYSVPYSGWGAPFAGLNQPGYYPYPAPYPAPYPQNGPGQNGPGQNGPGQYGPGQYGPGMGTQVEPYGRQQPPPYYDGSYPKYRNRSPVPWRSRRPARPPHGGPNHGGSNHGGSGGGGHGGGGSA